MPNPENMVVGGQSVLAGPADSWVVDFRVPPDEGNYLIVNHAFGSPARLAYGEKKMRISIIGNSFYPKVAVVPAGTTIEWTNEDVFAFFDGEFSGIHDVKGYEGPSDFWSPMLGHGEKWSVTLGKKGEYKYICTPHPYMEGVIRVE